jgi:hypothetical protein
MLASEMLLGPPSGARPGLQPLQGQLLLRNTDGLAATAPVEALGRGGIRYARPCRVGRTRDYPPVRACWLGLLGRKANLLECIVSARPFTAVPAGGGERTCWLGLLGRAADLLAAVDGLDPRVDLVLVPQRLVARREALDALWRDG